TTDTDVRGKRLKDAIRRLGNLVFVDCESRLGVADAGNRIFSPRLCLLPRPPKGRPGKRHLRGNACRIAHLRERRPADGVANVPGQMNVDELPLERDALEVHQVSEL